MVPNSLMTFNRRHVTNRQGGDGKIFVERGVYDLSLLYSGSGSGTQGTATKDTSTTEVHVTKDYGRDIGVNETGKGGKRGFPELNVFTGPRTKKLDETRILDRNYDE